MVRTALNGFYAYDVQQTELKYLINQHKLSENTAVVLLPFYPRLFEINNTDMSSVAISGGYLYVHQINESTNVTIKGHSGTATCIMDVYIKLVEGETDVYRKKVFMSMYKNENNLAMSFDLSQYFGGNNLRYEIDNCSKEVNYKLEHINTYQQQINSNYSHSPTSYNKIIEIDKNSYWLAKFSTTEAHFYRCQLNTSFVNCAENN